MSAPAYTPGPWRVFRVQDGPNKGQLLGIGDDDGGGITDARGGLWRDGSEMDANAHLIAAAPDLLEACQALIVMATTAPPVELVQHLDRCVIKAAAAIAKALGQSEGEGEASS